MAQIFSMLLLSINGQAKQSGRRIEALISRISELTANLFVMEMYERATLRRISSNMEALHN